MSSCPRCRQPSCPTPCNRAPAILSFRRLSGAPRPLSSSEPVEKTYPWEKTEDDEQEPITSSAEDELEEPTIESLMDEIRIDSETDLDEENLSNEPLSLH